MTFAVIVPELMCVLQPYLHVPVWALQTGLVPVRRVDEVRILLADVGKAGVVGGCVGGERPVADVGHWGKSGQQRVMTQAGV